MGRSRARTGSTVIVRRAYLPVRTSAAPCSALGCDHEDPELALITGTGTGGGTASGTDRQER